MIENSLAISALMKYCLLNQLPMSDILDGRVRVLYGLSKLFGYSSKKIGEILSKSMENSAGSINKLEISLEIL